MFSIPIEFKYNLESEIERVKETLDILDWLTKNKYRFLLPEGIKSKDISKEEIKKLIEKEYDLEIYKTAEEAVLKSWKGNNKTIKEINEKMTGSKIIDKLNVILTKYGTQGSYILPNSVIINISKVPPEFLIKTVIHESIHLMIEHLIKDYSVEHWVKEHIVDLIIDFEFKSRFKMQSVPDWVLPADNIFKDNYPNIDIVIKKSSELSPN